MEVWENVVGNEGTQRQTESAVGGSAVVRPSHCSISSVRYQGLQRSTSAWDLWRGIPRKASRGDNPSRNSLGENGVGGRSRQRDRRCRSRQTKWRSARCIWGTGYGQSTRSRIEGSDHGGPWAPGYTAWFLCRKEAGMALVPYESQPEIWLKFGVQRREDCRCSGLIREPSLRKQCECIWRKRKKTVCVISIVQIQKTESMGIRNGRCSPLCWVNTLKTPLSTPLDLYWALFARHYAQISFVFILIF